MKFNNIDTLVKTIQTTDQVLKDNVHAVINRSVTVRAWLIGMYIVEYEQNGCDRAKYGDKLIRNLSVKLGENSYSVSTLKDYRQFYLCYPQLREPLSNYIIKESSERFQLQQLLFYNQNVVKSQPVVGISSDGFAQQFEDGTVEPVPQMLFERISYSHFTLLIHVSDPTKRSFLAIETMRGPWSKRELKRQIVSNYYERSGWSKNPLLLAKKVDSKAQAPSFIEDLKSPYTFEFLGLSSKDIIAEDDFEDAIIVNFQDFIMELGMGFCLEARQKKLLIDNEYKKADLVFYHRILKCHVIVELKARELEYGDIMQLNMYIEYYRKHYMLPDDNPPIGLLLCTAYGKEMVDYLSPFTDPQLFVAKYQLQLPSKERIQEFLMKENKISR